MEENKKYLIRSRIWITTEDGTFLGEGRVNLLKQIDKWGSISKASKEMKMSYKKAWELVNSMNQQGREVLVAPTTGGAGGGGSVLSEAGRKAVEIYTKLNAENMDYLDSKLEKLDL